MGPVGERGEGQETDGEEDEEAPLPPALSSYLPSTAVPPAEEAPSSNTGASYTARKSPHNLKYVVRVCNSGGSSQEERLRLELDAIHHRFLKPLRNTMSYIMQRRRT